MNLLKTGIASIGVQMPHFFMPVTQLATLRGVDPAKYTQGLGCHEMALCSDADDVISLAVGAARRALDRWRGSIDDIGLLAIGTESAKDMSRPLSAWVANELGLSGKIRSYEVKHACYGGTLALRQAFEWRTCGAGCGKAALVIATDVALYALGDPGEPTQGAGAVAMIVDEPLVAELTSISFPYSKPEFDFWRPVGQDFPSVDGPLSLACYKHAAAECFRALVGDRDAWQVLDQYAALCFHVPFPKMVKKAVDHLGQEFGWSVEQTADLFQRKVEHTLQWNRVCGNAYTASLWISVARALGKLQAGEKIAAFSYGSGYGAELLELLAGPQAHAFAWAEDVKMDLDLRKPINVATYAALRQTSLAAE